MLAFGLQPAGVQCVCVKKHSPISVVLEHHHIWPQQFGGPTVPENLVWICASTHNTVHCFIGRMIEAGQELSVTELRRILVKEKYPPVINPYAYDLAVTGYRRIKSQSL